MQYYWKFEDVLKAVLYFIKLKFRKSILFYLIFHLPNIIGIMIKARSIIFFTSVNPGLFSGGLVGYSKYDINQQFKKSLRPKSIAILQSEGFRKVISRMKKEGINYPIILKPDIGERSKGVSYIENKNQLKDLLNKARFGNKIIEEYISKQNEYGILYCKLPGAQKGKITSFVRKAGVPKKASSKTNFYNISKKLKYFSLSSYITDELVEVIDHVSSSIDGFYFGRFDIKADNIQDIINGKFYIIELNGIGSVPLHLYDPQIGLLSCFNFYNRHYRTAFEIAKTNILSDQKAYNQQHITRSIVKNYLKISSY